MANKLKPGDKAPDFTLPDKDGNRVSLKDFKGKWIVLYFYPKDNTPGCTIEAREFTKQTDDYSDLNAVIIGVSADSPDSHVKFTNKFGLKIQLLSDEDHKVMVDYGAWDIKKMYGKEYWGIVRSTFLIDPEGKIAETWYNVKVKGHVDEVRNKLESLKK